MAEWLTEEHEHAIVVRPLDDIIIHSRTEECVCVPSVIEYGFSCIHNGRSQLAITKMINHNFMDGGA